jgi:tetratricopeptide (TPR) repeat protein
VDAGQAEKGIARIEKSLELNHTAHGYCYLAIAHLKIGDFEAARKSCESAITLDPTFEEALYFYGEAVQVRSRTKVIGWYRKAIDLNPKYTLAWHALGRELIAMAPTIKEGINALLVAESQGMKDGWNQAYLANAFWKLDNLAEAERYYRAAIEAAPDFPQFHKAFGQFLMAVGRRADAAPHIRAAGSTWNNLNKADS